MSIKQDFGTKSRHLYEHIDQKPQTILFILDEAILLDKKPQHSHVVEIVKTVIDCCQNKAIKFQSDHSRKTCYEHEETMWQSKETTRTENKKFIHFVLPEKIPSNFQCRHEIDMHEACDPASSCFPIK